MNVCVLIPDPYRNNLTAVQFHGKLVQDGQNGGYEAARLLARAVEEHVQNVVCDPLPNTRNRIRVYANVKGLAKTYCDANILHTEESLTAFIHGFNKAIPLYDFVDAGNGKECADVKLRC